MSNPSQDDDSPAVSHPVPTPRGGFMARPGLKTPPRHAVVVRGGNAPVSDEIPVARSSAPPPPPAERERVSQPPISASDKVTLPALRTPRSPAVGLDSSERPTVPLRTLLPPPPETPRGFESLPPPSDAPVAASVREPARSQRKPRRRSNWPLVIAAAVGLLFGMVSIATSTSARRGATQPPAPVAQELAAVQTRPLPSARALAVKPVAQPHAPVTAPSARAAQPVMPVRKKSIF